MQGRLRIVRSQESPRSEQSPSSQEGHRTLLFAVKRRHASQPSGSGTRRRRCSPRFRRVRGSSPVRLSELLSPPPCKRCGLWCQKSQPSSADLAFYDNQGTQLLQTRPCGATEDASHAKGLSMRFISIYYYAYQSTPLTSCLRLQRVPQPAA
jgi:hypothetical protein